MPHASRLRTHVSLPRSSQPVAPHLSAVGRDKGPKSILGLTWPNVPRRVILELAMPQQVRVCRPGDSSASDRGMTRYTMVDWAAAKHANLAGHSLSQRLNAVESKPALTRDQLCTNRCSNATVDQGLLMMIGSGGSAQWRLPPRQSRFCSSLQAATGTRAMMPANNAHQSWHSQHDTPKRRTPQVRPMLWRRRGGDAPPTSVPQTSQGESATRPLIPDTSMTSLHPTAFSPPPAPRCRLFRLVLVPPQG